MDNNLKYITASTYEDYYYKETFTVVYAMADWFKPSLEYKAEFEKAAKMMKDKADFVLFNITEEKHLAAKFLVKDIPSLLFFKNAKVTNIIVGNKSADEFIEICNNIFKNN